MSGLPPTSPLSPSPPPHSNAPPTSFTPFTTFGTRTDPVLSAPSDAGTSLPGIHVEDSNNTPQQPSPPGTMPTIPSALPTSNPLANTNRRNSAQFYSSALRSNYTIPPIEEEITAYRIWDHRTLWPAQSNFSRRWLYQYERDDLRARVAVTTLINQAHFLWRKGERVPRIYPAENNLSFFPDEMIHLMEGALELD